MKIRMSHYTCTLFRQRGDKALSAETNVVFHMKRLLNAKGYNFVRMNPSKHGLTECQLGLYDKKRDLVLWHERYAIERAHVEFNKHGQITFDKVKNASR